MTGSRRKEDRRAAGELPQNDEAERAVLGAVLLHNDAHETASAIISDRDFYRVGNRQIWIAIDRLLEWKGGSADYLTVRDELAKRGELDEAGGAAYISGLIDGVPRSTNIDHYARIVLEKSRLRQLIVASNKILTAAYEAEEPADSILAAADRSIIELQAGRGGESMQTLAESRPKLFEDLEWREKHRGEVTGVPSGFASIDEVTIGWQPGDLIVIGARPSIGKTTFVTNAAVAAGLVGKRGAVFSLEMRRLQLEYRILSGLSGIPLQRLLGGAMMSTEWPKLTAAVETMSALPISIDDRAGLSYFDIRRACRLMKSDGGLDFIVIDYVQLMPGSLEDKRATRNEQVTDISRRLKILAGELECPILLLSQLSRAASKRNDPTPQLSDLRESGALEQDADLVCFLHRKDHRAGGLTYFIVAKQRNGPTGTLKLSLERETVLFTDAPALEEPKPAPRTKAKPEAPAEKDRYKTDS